MRTCYLYDNANSEFNIIAKDGKLEVKAEGLEFGDNYHTMHELYQHRMALNIALFNHINIYEKYPGGPQVIKSKLHHDGTMFDGGYFIVMLIYPNKKQIEPKTFQISYHYKLKHWDKFKIPEVERAPEWDRYTSSNTLERLLEI